MSRRRNFFPPGEQKNGSYVIAWAITRRIELATALGLKGKIIELRDSRATVGEWQCRRKAGPPAY